MIDLKKLSDIDRAVYCILLAEEKYKVLSLWQQAENGELKGKKLIMYSPLHKDINIHGVIVNKVRNAECQIVKKY